MDIVGQYLEAREGGADGAARRMAELDRKKAAEIWILTGRKPEERLLAFDAWVRGELASRLDWAWAGKHKEKRLEQCRGVLEKMVLALWKRGWMIDGARLARRIEELLDAVGKYQRAGKVVDFWPYFEASVKRYVGLNAEELQAEAMKAGAHMNQALIRFLSGTARPVSLPELVAERAAEVTDAKAHTLRTKLARCRSKNKVSEATLPGF